MTGLSLATALVLVASIAAFVLVAIFGDSAALAALVGFMGTIAAVFGVGKANAVQHEEVMTELQRVPKKRSS